MTKFKNLRIISNFIFILRKRIKIILFEIFLRKKYPFNILDYAIKFIINECISGDYYEFGVFKGENLIAFNRKFNKILKRRLKNKMNTNVLSNNKRINLKKQLEYHAFDSFEGIPPYRYRSIFFLILKRGNINVQRKILS